MSAKSVLKTADYEITSLYVRGEYRRALDLGPGNAPGRVPRWARKKRDAANVGLLVLGAIGQRIHRAGVAHREAQRPFEREHPTHGAANDQRNLLDTDIVEHMLMKAG